MNTDIDITEALRHVHAYIDEIGDQPFRLRDTDLPSDAATFLVDNHYVIEGSDGFVDDVADLPAHPRRLFPDDMRIRAVGHNPKRPGTKTHARFEHFFDAATVGDYVARVTAGDAATTRKQALLDVAWAMERGQIVEDSADTSHLVAAE